MDGRQLLEQAAGEWEGTYKLWFRPTDEPDAQSATRATITSELGGRSLLLRYDWIYEEQQRDGLALISRTDDDGLQMGWTDTFHYSSGVLHNTALGMDAKVLGHYGPPEEPWGWRTEFEMPSSDELEFRAYNILPDGTEALATEAIYRRLPA